MIVKEYNVILVVFVIVMKNIGGNFSLKFGSLIENEIFKNLQALQPRICLLDR
jgi:hypothetical protein